MSVIVSIAKGAVAAVAAVVVGAVWGATTVTMIGPTVQHFLSRSDARLLEETKKKCLDSGEFMFLTTSAGNRLFSRFRDRRAEPGAKSLPIVIPNGLAATLMTTARLHERLESCGYTVLSFDRPGVGYSEPRAAGPEAQPVDEVLQDMRDAMLACIPDVTQKWIVLGPSMGGIVCECFIAEYPDFVAGFVNLDGFSHSFDAQREKFLGAAKYYSVARATAWTGSLRVPMRAMSSKFADIQTSFFPTEAIRADMNRAAFWGNTQLEFTIMLDLAKRASERWGDRSIGTLPRDVVESLARVAPRENGDLNEDGTWTALPRSADEIGDRWLDADEVRELSQRLAAVSLPPLAARWAQLPVAVLSARSYDFTGGDWYEPEMRLTAAAEHASLVIHALPGSARFTFPKIDHTQLFMRANALVMAADLVHQLATSPPAPA